MAKPAFIYAFDNLGPEKFAELCGLLLAARHKGFVLGGVGPDGGVDGEVDDMLGSWTVEVKDALLNEIVQPNQTVVFQFKHVVTGRVGGQSRARDHLLGMYKCSDGKSCEIHKSLVLAKNPFCYVLVTNVEVNSNFRERFIRQCKQHNPNITRYQVIGLDELEGWLTTDANLRHLYFPAMFGPPRFQLRVHVSKAAAFVKYSDGKHGDPTDMLMVSVMNVGTETSYVSSVSFRTIVDGQDESVYIYDLNDGFLKQINPPSGAAVEPGRRLDYKFPYEVLNGIRRRGKEVFPYEVWAYDEIGNLYTGKIPEELIHKILDDQTLD